MLVLATYASLVPQGLEVDQGGDQGGGEGSLAWGERAGAPGVREQALRGSFGQRMGAFDLLVVDEAHRTSGAIGKAWAVVHDQERLTATAPSQDRPRAAEQGRSPQQRTRVEPVAQPWLGRATRSSEG